MILVISMAIVGPATVIVGSIRVAPVIAVIAARVIAISITRISIVAVTVCGVADSDSAWTDSNRHLGVSLFDRN